MAKSQQKAQQKAEQGKQKSSGAPGAALRGGKREKLTVKKGQTRKQARQARHPRQVECRVTCTCGNEFVTQSSVPTLSLDVCSRCHPFFSGQQRFMDTAGRIEKFQRKYNWKDGQVHAESPDKPKPKRRPATESLED